MSDAPMWPASGLIEDLPPRDLLRGLFHLLFGREPDLDHDALLAQLESGNLSPRQALEWLIHSAEWSHSSPMSEFGPSLHFGRGVFIRSLPPAKRILDIGGASVGDPAGAMVLMGYPYQFDELIVVDLPSEDRHELYQDEARPTTVGTPCGPVTYRYHSMTDLSGYKSHSFDMVYSGESIEHVTRHDANKVLSQARRVLKRGGILALDTPNAVLTRLQQQAFVDPDHKYEYTHKEMAAVIEGNGYLIQRAVGINYGGRSVADGTFDFGELATKRGVFDRIEDCYLLGYVCRRPSALAPLPILRRLRWSLIGPLTPHRRLLSKVRRRLTRPG